MSRNAFIAVAKLGTHPAFSFIHGGVLVCPICQDHETTSAKDFDEHFLSHDPTPLQGELWLSGDTFDRVAVERGWAERCAGSLTTVAGAEQRRPWSKLRPSRSVRCASCGRHVKVRRGIVAPHPAVISKRED